jgi:hypothetical protein
VLNLYIVNDKTLRASPTTWNTVIGKRKKIGNAALRTSDRPDTPVNTSPMAQLSTYVSACPNRICLCRLFLSIHHTTVRVRHCDHAAATLSTVLD